MLVSPNHPFFSFVFAGVTYNFDNAIADCLLEMFNRASRPAVEYEEYWLVFLESLHLFDVGLMELQEFGLQIHSARLIDTMNIPKSSGNGKVFVDTMHCLVDFPDVLWLSVQSTVFHIFIVLTVLYSTSDSDFHLEELVHFCS